MLPLAAMALALPLHFEPNGEPARDGARWTAAGNGYTLLLSDTAVKMRLAGGAEVAMALPRTAPEGMDLLSGRSNYYGGSRQRVGVPQYGRVRYRAVYAGVDLEIYGKGLEAEYDWIVAPGADPGLIRMRFTGSRPRVDQAGDLVFDTAAGQVRHRRPRVFQGEKEVAGEFVLDRNEVRFRLGVYDRTKTLVIDPQIVWSTGFGGSGFSVNFPGVHGAVSDEGTGIAVDASGNSYITGTTFSMDFPTVNPVQGSPACIQAGCRFRSMFVTKLSPDGKTILYSTYIGAKLVQSNFSLPPVLPGAIAVDAAGNAYVTGVTDGTNLPVAGMKTAGGNDAFLLKLDGKGSLADLRLFGGSGDDAGTALRFAPDGTLFLAGTTQSADFPTTPAAYRGKLSSTQDVFVLRVGFNPVIGSQEQSTVLYSTYLGPGNTPALAVDSASSAYVAASATAGTWATTPGVVQPNCGDSRCADVVVAKLDAGGSKLLYATYLGGSDVDMVGGIAVDGAGSAYVAGTTFSDGQSAGTVFVRKLSPDATSLVYSSGVSGTVTAQAIAVDAAGNAYVAGGTTSSNLVLIHAVQATPYNSICDVYTPSGSIPINQVPCVSAGFVSVLGPDGKTIPWSTYLGSGTARALALDAAGDLFVTGQSIALSGGTVGVVKIAPTGAPVQFLPGSGITDGASFAPGLPRPGGLATIFLQGGEVTGMETAMSYPLPTELAGVSILVDGVPAPMLAVVAPGRGEANPINVRQINFQVPFEAKSNVVEVRYKGVSTFAIPPRIAPGLFALPDGSGAIQHGADYSLVTTGHPAKKGEVVILYLTGLGLVDPLPVTGDAATQAAPMKPHCQPPFVNVGDILYAGITPGFAGLYQLNVRLSDTLSSGINDVQLRWWECWLGAPPDSFYLSNTVRMAVE